MIKRLIEDYLPIERISAEASREKAVRSGHISTLHLWWARRPIVACRAAIYGALVPASRFVPNGASDEKKKSLGRANAAKFVERLCQYPGIPATIVEAQYHILEAQAERLTQETKIKTTVEDIIEGRAARPKVLDMFAGGGAIPLEALRLGCESYALDLNPVAYIIQLCTLVYPQRYAKPDLNTTGCSEDGKWAGLAQEIRNWGGWVLERARSELADSYPSIPDLEAPSARQSLGKAQLEIPGRDFDLGRQKSLSVELAPGSLTPTAYLWTRTVPCKNPTCGATVPLVRQTWLCKRGERLIALKATANKERKQIVFEVVKGLKDSDFDFSPDAGSKGGNAICLFCGTTADDTYIRDLGMRKKTGLQLMAVACKRSDGRQKVYLPSYQAENAVPSDEIVSRRIQELCASTGLTVPGEPINPLRPSPWTRGASGVTRHGLAVWGDLFTSRQMLSLLTFAAKIREAVGQMEDAGYAEPHARAIASYLALSLDKVVALNCSLTRWKADAELCVDAFGRQALPMVWDFAEQVPYSGIGGSWQSQVSRTVEGLNDVWPVALPAIVERGNATALPWPDSSFDAIVTDPPYYDNVPYADISDFYYVWLKRTIGSLFPEHFASEGTPKKTEITALSSRHGGDMDKARDEYESLMARSFQEAHRVLKQNGQMVVVYAHKTTLGWSTLVDALRRAGFTVSEAWPLQTEMKSRLLAKDTACLASSIFLVTHKRSNREKGRYEDVRSQLATIVGERVATLWDSGITGADLVIACVGAGLRAFTRYETVEYANGDEVPAERFLTEVETVVLETILAQLSREVGGNGGRYGLASVDASTRFYTLWRYTYRSAELDAGEAIIFANGTHVELDGLHGLSSGTRPLVEKKKAKYRLLDYSERGENSKLGLPTEEVGAVPLIDSLHRLCWLMERHPSAIPEFLRAARPNTEQLRLVAQALAGPALKGGELDEVATGTELAALAKLTANWRSVVEDTAEAAIGSLFRSER